MRNPQELLYNKPWWLKGLIILGFVILGAAGAAAFALIFGYLVMLLWNWLMPEIFELGTITFWQAAGITILARLVFGGFKHGGYHSSSSKKEHHWRPAKPSPCGPTHNKWEYYDEFWQNEGKDAFENYIAQKNGTDNENKA
ncbi:MAG: hypothetical protein ACOC31_04105 [Bacteroidota bacterium]